MAPSAMSFEAPPVVECAAATDADLSGTPLDVVVPVRRSELTLPVRALLAVRDAVADLVLAPAALAFTAAGRAVRAPTGLAVVMILLICVPMQFRSGGSAFGLGDVISGLFAVAAVVHVAREGRGVHPRCAALFGGALLAASVATVTAH